MTIDTPHSTQPSRKRMQIAIVGLGVTIGLLIYAGLNYFGPSISSGTLNQLASRIPISPETTIYTSPIDEHGFVNFNEAFYDEMGEGISPENNAAYGIVRAFGGRGDSGFVMKDVCEFLRIEPADENGHFFRSLTGYGEQVADWDSAEISSVYDDQDAAMTKPWSEGEYPRIAQWLEANASSMELIKESLKKPHYFVRRDSEGDGMVAILLDDIMQVRSVARYLNADAMRKCGEGDFEAAWKDILAIYRLGHLISHCPFLVERLVGHAIDGIARHATVAWLNALPDNYEGLSDKRDEIDRLPPLDSIKHGIRCERIIAIDSVISTLKGAESLELLDANAPAMLRHLSRSSLDWEHILRRLNEAYDSIENGFDLPTYADQKVAIAAQEERLKNFSAVSSKYYHPLTHAKWALLPGARRREASELVANIYLSLLLPSMEGIINIGPRSEGELGLVKIAFVMTEYRINNGRLPVTFDEAGLPTESTPITDHFDQQPFRIVPDGPDHVWIWQIGFDGVDDSVPAATHELASGDYGFRLGPLTVESETDDLDSQQKQESASEPSGSPATEESAKGDCAA